MSWKSLEAKRMRTTVAARRAVPIPSCVDEPPLPLAVSVPAPRTSKTTASPTASSSPSGSSSAGSDIVSSTAHSSPSPSSSPPPPHTDWFVSQSWSGASMSSSTISASSSDHVPRTPVSTPRVMTAPTCEAALAATLVHNAPVLVLPTRTDPELDAYWEREAKTARPPQHLLSRSVNFRCFQDTRYPTGVIMQEVEARLAFDVRNAEDVLCVIDHESTFAIMTTHSPLVPPIETKYFDDSWSTRDTVLLCFHYAGADKNKKPSRIASAVYRYQGPAAVELVVALRAKGWRKPSEPFL